MTQSCQTGTDVGAVPWFSTTNEMGTDVPEKTPFGGGVMLVTTRSGSGTCAHGDRGRGDGRVVAEVRAFRDRPGGVGGDHQPVRARIRGRLTCWVRWTEAPTASEPSNSKLPSSVGLSPWASVAA